MAKSPARERPKVIIIKKKGGGHAHHGGAWKVAYADFVTAMMALFMVLWLVSQTDEPTRSELAHYFRSGVFSGSGHVIGDSVPLGHGPTIGGGRPQLSEQGELESTAGAVQRALDLTILEDPSLASLREQIDVRVEADGLLIQISEGGDDLLFGLSSADLTPTLRVFLSTLGPVLGRLSNQIQIHGHTDARPFPSGAQFDNWDLSFHRADEARAFLDAHGLRPGQVSAVVGHADAALLYPEDPLDPRNRRLSILAVRRGAEAASAHGTPVAAIGSTTPSTGDEALLDASDTAASAAHPRDDAGPSEPDGSP